MKPDWNKLYLEIVRMQSAIALFRSDRPELANSDVEKLLAAVRACNVELIALRSALENARQPTAPSGGSSHR